jgi:DNA-binding beta-propeller fold protein YncE
MRRAIPLLPIAVLAAAFLVSCGGGSSPTGPSNRCGEPGTICTVMGLSRAAYLGEGDTPDKVALYYPIDLAFDQENRLLVLDWNNLRIRRLDHDGRVRTIMGTGWEATPVPGQPASETPLHHTFSMCFDSSWKLYMAGFHVPMIVTLDKSLTVGILAGIDSVGFGGDGGPASKCLMNNPCGVAVAPAGYPVWVGDTYNNRIRRIDADGTIHTVAGTGERGYAGDEGPGTQCELNYPFRVRYDDATGNLYISDTENSVIRVLDPEGDIHTVAGTGVAGYSGDGGPATRAQLNNPLDAKIGPDGLLYIVDSANNCIRRVDADGTIHTIVGTGVAGNSGDGGPAEKAQLKNPSCVIWDKEGNLWITDMFNCNVREVTAWD